MLKICSIDLPFCTLDSSHSMVFCISDILKVLTMRILVASSCKQARATSCSMCFTGNVILISTISQHNQTGLKYRASTIL